MNLPIFNQLVNNQSTYITFSKSLLDFDYSTQYNKPYYFSKMVALNLPVYAQSTNFSIDLNSVNITSENPNITIPKGMQYYMENIIRQKFPTQYNTNRITEIAFYKFLNKCGLSISDIQNNIVFINDIVTSNFTNIGNNNGWSEIVCMIPNDSKKLVKSFKSLNLPDEINCTNTDLCLFDNGNKQFLFNNDFKQVIDFDNIMYNSVPTNSIESFDFNCFLVFYKDELGVDKLHGINFINPFINKLTTYELPKYTQITNDVRSIGYQFKLNMKTVNNEATKIIVENHLDGFWSTHYETLTKLNSFLELQTQKSLINL